ncbi:MAG: GNAT family N-acetyltransferase [Promethearchaeota archaeon]
MNESSIRIEKAKSEDLQNILLVINRANWEAFGRIIPKPYFKEPILTQEELDAFLEKMTFYVHRHQKQVVAVAALSIEDDMNSRIRWVYVLPEYQRRGIGTALVLHLETVAREMGFRKVRLVTDNGAEWAISFYQKLGYTLAYRVRNPWGFDVWMEKHL